MNPDPDPRFNCGFGSEYTNNSGHIGSTRLTYVAAFLICLTAVPWYVAAVLDLNTAQHKMGVIFAKSAYIITCTCILRVDIEREKNLRFNFFQIKPLAVGLLKQSSQTFAQEFQVLHFVQENRLVIYVPDPKHFDTDHDLDP